MGATVALDRLADLVRHSGVPAGELLVVPVHNGPPLPDVAPPTSTLPRL
ncbi:hypothetical protein SAMN04489747_1049 [Auraticoccus monumenti]|uniref:Uncharacterized protein n=1 Tax=Auraticoccus monumenti TaxID=675864 RepID=A0A1G6V583_9ACTN|nr:hypothetical protein SAMN04489747_1049 [Auraticoccus monumenti]